MGKCCPLPIAWLRVAPIPINQTSKAPLLAPGTAAQAAYTAHAATLGQQGTWVWECHLGGETWQAYSAELVRMFETNHAAGKLTFSFARDGTRYAADLTDSTRQVQRRDDGQFSTERLVRRRQVQLFLPQWAPAAVPVPSEWDAPDEVSLKQPRPVELPDGAEKDRVVQLFNTTLGGKPRRVVRVDRIQNWRQWQRYILRLAEVVEREQRETAGPLTQSDIEREDLFHGTSETVAPQIVRDGFNRSFAGDANAHVFGQGSYFASTSRYSEGYSKPGARGHQSMFLCRVVVGRSCKGVGTMKQPPQRQGLTSTRYDTTVDDVHNPTIFVTYHDSGAYPTHLITFESTSTAAAPPHAAPAAPAQSKCLIS